MQNKNLQMKRVLRTALLVLLLGVVGMMKMYAYNFSAVCSTGQTLYYNITNSTNHYVEVTFPASNNNPWINCTMPTGALVIPGTVSYNGITYSVKSIGIKTFQTCRGLTSVTIPNSVTSIGDSAFALCTGLTSITIPNSVTSIGVAAFSRCSSLISVTIPSSMTSIGENAFFACSDLTSVYCTGSIKQWCGISFGARNSNPLCQGGKLYINNALVTDLVIPSSVTSIGDYTFLQCKSLTSVTIPNSVTSIGNDAFDNCSSLTSVYYTGSIEQWCGISFGNRSSNPLRQGGKLYINNALVTDLVIPSSVTSIGDYTFLQCISLTSVTIPNSVTSIGEFAFSGCSSLTSVAIGNSVTSIGNYAFASCSGLSSIEIPNSVTSIGDYAFNICDNITSVYYTGSVEQWCGICFGNDSSNPCRKNLYINNALVRDLVIPSSVTSIGVAAFSRCSSLISVTIPNSVTSIGDCAFYDCCGLTSVTLGNSVTSIGSSAFRWCTSLTSIEIPNSVTSIGNEAFYRCSGLTYIIVQAIEPPLLGDEVFIDVPILVVSCGSKHDYIVSDWANCFSTISEDCTQHSINIDNISSNGGSVSVSTSSANLGEEVRVTITPNQGMSLSSLIVCNASDPSQTVPVYPISKSISTYGFLMPPYDVAVKAVFVVGNAIGEGNNIAASIYPNPTTGRVNIEADDLKHVSISNILGQTIYEREASGNKFTYDFGQQKDGVYLIIIETSNGVVTKRVVVAQ